MFQKHGNVAHTSTQTGKKNARNKYDKLMKICHIFGTLDCNVAFLFWILCVCVWFFFYIFFFIRKPTFHSHFWFCGIIFSSLLPTFSLVWCHFYCHVYRLLVHLHLRLLFCLDYINLTPEIYRLSHTHKTNKTFSFVRGAHRLFLSLSHTLCTIYFFFMYLYNVHVIFISLWNDGGVHLAIVVLSK